MLAPIRPRPTMAKLVGDSGIYGAPWLPRSSTAVCGAGPVSSAAVRIGQALLCGVVVPSMLFVTACAGRRAVQVDLGDGRARTLVAVDGCDDFATDPVSLRRGQPVKVLVHGCNASSARFHDLADVFRENGQQ